MDRIAVINVSTVLSDAAILPMVAAVQKQIDEHFYPAWGTPAQLQFIPTGQRPPAGYWQAAILDNADQAGALGYHDITIEGLPLAKIFAATDLKYGYLVPVTLSHEILEMLADPDVNLLVADVRRVRRFWAYEVCDAVEADRLGYDIVVPNSASPTGSSTVRVSDFVTPAYFETFRRTGPFDYLNHLNGPVPALTPGGYMAYVQDGVWHQVFAKKSQSMTMQARDCYQARPTQGGRRYRRALRRKDWIHSTVDIES